MTSLEAKKEFRRPLILTAGIIGIVQAVGWSVLSLLSILCYHGIIDIDEKKVNYGNYLYYLFHVNSTIDDDKIIMNPLPFNITMCIYLVLSFLWIWISSFLTWGMLRDKWSNIILAVKFWVVLTILISLLDLILMVLLAVDYHTIFGESNVNDQVEKFLAMILQAVYGIVISLAARGFVLWIVNVVFCIVLSNFASQMQKEDRPNRLSVIDAYATTAIPRFDTGKVNEGFVPDNNSPRSSFNPLSIASSSSNNNVQLSSSNVQYFRSPEYFTPNTVQYPRRNTVDRLRSHTTEALQQSADEQPKFDRVAKIGKSWGRRTPPQNVSPPSVPKAPFIPAPDYSPPSSPEHQPKSVLRSQSKYKF